MNMKKKMFAMAGLVMVCLIVFIGILCIGAANPGAMLATSSMLFIGFGFAVVTEKNNIGDVLHKENTLGTSRDVVTVASGQTLLVGAVLGKITKAIAAAVADEGNTGNGTVGTLSMSALARFGTYVLKCVRASDVKGASASAAAFAGNTGNGAMGEITVGANAKVGAYKLVMIEPGADAGTFSVEAPDGTVIGTGAVGAAFSVGDHLSFTLADGSTDFIAGDGFTLTVGASGAGGEFTVMAPDGTMLPSALIGTAYTSAQINFTIADGATDFVVGDAFTIAVSAGTGKVKALAPSAVDGTQDAYGVLAADTDASAADVKTSAFVRDALLKSYGLVWPDAITDDQKTVALATLKVNHILVKEAI